MKRLADMASRWFDPAAALVIAGFCLVQLISTPPHGTGLTAGIAAVTAFGCIAVVLRRRYPRAVTLVFSLALFVPGVLVGARWENGLPATLLLAFVILAYTAGAELDRNWSVAGLLVLAVGNTTGNLTGDLVSVVVFTVPLWVAGRVVRSRTAVAAQLDARAQELEHEQEAYVREAVRFERARIARDLHDIVAHNLSMIVVQAGAGRRAIDSNPETATQSLAHITAGARQAELEIDSLIGLVARQDLNGESPGLQMLDELVRRAAATGLSVTYRLNGAHDAVPPELAQAAYHVTQEGITNALKHAPGAPITVAVDANARSLKVLVENGPTGDPDPGLLPDAGLQGSGGGYGIVGLRRRLEAIGGLLNAGPSAAGGWQLEADLPRSC